MVEASGGDRLSMRPRARVVHTLGSELISNENVALTELVKNAYDADATVVTIRFRGPLCKGAGAIEVWDNGHGMSIQTVQGSWLELATTTRKRAPLSESGTRRVLGEKGIGRLAGSRIGHQTTLTTRRFAAPEVRADVDWDAFEDDDAYLDEVDVRVRWNVSSVFDGSARVEKILGSPVEHGTLVRMSRLKRAWTRREIEELRASLSRLVPPRPAVAALEIAAPFSISLDVPGDLSDLSGQIRPVAAFEHPHYSITGSISRAGRAELIFENRLLSTREEFELNIAIPSGDAENELRSPEAGPLRVDIRAWDLDSTAFKSLANLVDLGVDSLSDYRNLIRTQSGVAIYRDGFRVQPFGESTFDWLSLDARRVNNPTTRLSNNQVRGFVFVSADDNPGLKDKSNREGLIDSVAFEDLKVLVTAVIGQLEIRRRLARRREDIDDLEKDRARGLFEGFSLSPIRELIGSRPNDPDLNRALESATEEISEGVRKVQDALSRYSRLATLGSLIDVILHDGRGALSRIQFAADELGRGVTNEVHSPGEFIKSAEKVLPRINAGASLLRSLFERIQPLSGRRGSKPKTVRLDTLIRSSIGLLESEFQRSRVQVDIRSDESLVTVEPAEIFQVLVNIYDNAIYWMSRQPPSEERRLVVDASSGESGIVVTVTDSGPGVPEALREAIFDPYFSGKPDGTGLGLAIAGSTVHDLYGGSLELVQSSELDGASFRVIFRERVGS